MAHANAVNHAHSHEQSVDSTLPKAPPQPPASRAWAHEHYHQHQYRQDYSQAYIFEHRHLHQHDGDTPKHALIDLTPDDRAIVRAVYGRSSINRRFMDIRLVSGAVVSKVQPADGGSRWELEIDGENHILNAEEAASVIIEVQ